MIRVRSDLEPLFGGLSFEDFLALGQRTVKASPDGRRRTASFERGGRRFFVKTHAGVGWREILRCWAQLKPAVVDARPEVRGLARCAARAIPVPSLAAWGVSGLDPARRRSFVVTEELDSAERLSARLERMDGARLPHRERRALAHALGALVGRLHAAGLVHRDLYLEHVFVRERPEPELFLLDLHRSLAPRVAFRRWRVKDLSGLLGSALRRGATRVDALVFLHAYAGSDPRAGAATRVLWQACARRLGRWEARRGARAP